MDKLEQSALRALNGPGVKAAEADAGVAQSPGLYAFFGDHSAWHDLRLNDPPDQRPLYVGKAESTLASRDLQGHFGMRDRGKNSPTGSSTLRRSVAALRAETAGYRGLPRNPEKPSHFSNYGLSVADDEDLSAWMQEELRIALWPHVDVSVLERIETAVLQKLKPPLNLTKVTTSWTAQVKAARAVLTSQAREAGNK